MHNLLGRCDNSYACMMFLLLWPWPWPSDLDIWTYSRCTCIPAMKFLEQGFQKLKHRHDRQTDRQTWPDALQGALAHDDNGVIAVYFKSWRWVPQFVGISLACLQVAQLQQRDRASSAIFMKCITLRLHCTLKGYVSRQYLWTVKWGMVNL